MRRKGGRSAPPTAQLGLAGVRIDGDGHAEVGDLRRRAPLGVIIHQDIARLDVLVYDEAAVEVVRAAHHLSRQAQAHAQGDRCRARPAKETP